MRNAVSLASLTALVLLGTVSHVAAGTTVAVPEISPASLSAGLAILAGGALMLRARRRK
jgi:LPXTG-motif cell wall-anchored protein